MTALSQVCFMVAVEARSAAVGSHPPCLDVVETRTQEQQLRQSASESSAAAEMMAGRSDKAKVPLPPPPAEKPEEFDFLLQLAPISALDYDVIKLTALYVARNGRSFLLNLSQREARNPQFEFLKVNHSLHPTFLRLVDQYSRVILPSKELLARLELDRDCRFKVLDRVWRRVQYARYIRQQQLNEEQKAQIERAAFESIDWHDFAIVETIDFGPADLAMELPKPLEASAIAKLTLVQRKELWSGNVLPGAPPLPLAGGSVAAAGGEDDEEDSMDVEPTTRNAQPPRATAPPPKRVDTGPSIRHDYVPKAATIAAAGSGGTKTQPIMVICPICSGRVPEGEIAEHMRVEALDPKWKEQRDRHLAKHVDTNYVISGAEVSQNLASMNMARRELTSLAQEELARKMQEAHRVSAAKAVIWDGRAEPTSIGIATKEAIQKARPMYEAQMAELSAAASLETSPPQDGQPSESAPTTIIPPPIGPRRGTRHRHGGQ